MWAGIMLIALAFSPKLTAALLIIPGPVMGSYLLAVMGTYIVEGIRTVGQDGLDHKKALDGWVSVLLWPCSRKLRHHRKYACRGMAAIPGQRADRRDGGGGC